MCALGPTLVPGRSRANGPTLAQAVVIAYDGLNPMPPAFCYLKPYYNDPNKTYFRQLEEGQL